MRLFGRAEPTRVFSKVVKIWVVSSAGRGPKLFQTILDTPSLHGGRTWQKPTGAQRYKGR